MSWCLRFCGPLAGEILGRRHLGLFGYRIRSAADDAEALAPRPLSSLMAVEATMTADSAAPIADINQSKS